MRIGDDNCLLVLDSGSSNLSVATQECLDKGECGLETTIGKATDGGYNPQTSSTARKIAGGGTLHYASLRVETKTYEDEIAFRISESVCPNRTVPLEADDALVETPSMRVPISAAHAMSGTDSNILGLMSDSAVLDALFRSLGLPRGWGMAAGVDGRGWLTVGAIPDCIRTRVDLKTIPLTSDYTYMGAYVVRIESVKLGPDPSSLAPLENAPQFLILDCGSAYSYLSNVYKPAFSAYGFPVDGEIVPEGAESAWPFMEITLEGGHKLGYSPKRYTAREADGRSSTFVFGNPDVKDLFGDDPVILFGLHATIGLYIHIDLDAQLWTVGVWDG